MQNQAEIIYMDAVTPDSIWLLGLCLVDCLKPEPKGQH